MRKKTLRLICSCVFGFFAATNTSAQVQPLEQEEIRVNFDSGQILVGDIVERDTVFSTVVRIPDASWIRLQFDRAILGTAPQGGQETILRLTSIQDGVRQHLNLEHLNEWLYTSAYFNGDAVMLEVISDPGAEPSRISIPRVWAGPEFAYIERSICGPTDDRVLSDDPRTSRLVPIGCTSWLIDDPNHCFLTAGHCTGSSAQICEFNVPLSDSFGNIQHPPPADQYAIDPDSMQSNGGQGIGNDWAYFGCFPNTETGLTPYEAQGDYFNLTFPPPVSGQDIRITGYGTTSPPVPNEWNQAQKTHVGPFVDSSGTVVGYQTDTTGGNSGSPVINEDTGEAIGIHTHGGCSSGQNNGTGIHHAGLQDALANPQGVCIPVSSLEFTFPNGMPEFVDPSGGTTMRVEVTGVGDEEPEPGTGLLHYNIGAGWQSLAMNEIVDNVYDAIFPAAECTVVIQYYVSAETVGNSFITEPWNAPDAYFTAISAYGEIVTFEDNFQTNTGWTVENVNVDTGAWVRAVPVGSGGGRGDPPTDADGSGMCYVTDNRFDEDVDGGPTRLLSPTFDLTNVPGAYVSYARWFYNDDNDVDRLDCEISDDNGASWMLMESVPHSSGWITALFKVSDFFTPNNQIRFRFSATDNPNNSVTEAGIDAFIIRSFICTSPCPADFTGDDVVNIDDIFAVLGLWGDCDDPCPPYCTGDLTEDCTINIDDVFAVLGQWGPCD